MLPGPDEVQAAMAGPGGALGALAAGATWIDMTSNPPAAVRPSREAALARGVAATGHFLMSVDSHLGVSSDPPG